MYNIDKKYGVPIESISCPGCGLKYGHHNTKVDINSQECSSCASEFRPKSMIRLVHHKYYIEEVMDIKPLMI